MFRIKVVRFRGGHMIPYTFFFLHFLFMLILRLINLFSAANVCSLDHAYLVGEARG
jgi:hypothetical protein